MANLEENNQWAAIGISTLAGSATILGGLSILCVTKFKPLPYSFCMALSAGVMVYVSFVEIFTEAVEQCQSGLYHSASVEGPVTEEETITIHGNGYLLATCCLFVGWFFADFLHWILSVFIRKLDIESTAKFDNDGNFVIPGKDTLCANPDTSPTDDDDVSSVDSTESQVAELKSRANAQFNNKFMEWLCPAPTGSDLQAQELADQRFKDDQAQFLKVGIFTALILGVHNIPEGMGTFTGYMEDPTFGLAMAFAIGVHNIPEGISVAVPAYFGTGSVWKALALCSISAVAEPLGGFIAWGILGKEPSDLAFGILFGLICGVMSNVAIKELLVSSLRYDPANRVAMKSFVLGMVIMSVSLVSFTYIE